MYYMYTRYTIYIVAIHTAVVACGASGSMQTHRAITLCWFCVFARGMRMRLQRSRKRHLTAGAFDWKSRWRICGRIDWACVCMYVWLQSRIHVDGDATRTANNHARELSPIYRKDRRFVLKWLPIPKRCGENGITAQTLLNHNCLYRIYKNNMKIEIKIMIKPFFIYSKFCCKYLKNTMLPHATTQSLN